MKQLLFISPSLLAVIGFNSCEKSTIGSKTEIVETRYVGGITAKLYRATTNRPREGKNCGCTQCFGLCDIRGVSSNESGNDPTMKIIDIIISSSTKKARLYIPSNTVVTGAESEFGVDEILTIPEEILPLGYTSGNFKVGVYQYVAVTISYHNKGLESALGYIDIDIHLNQ